MAKKNKGTGLWKALLIEHRLPWRYRYALYGWIKDAYHEYAKKMPLDDFGDYDDYWSKRGFPRPSVERARLISPSVAKGKNVLDIGCGDGTLIDYLHKRNSPGYICGIDISSSAVKHVKKKGYDADVVDILSGDFKKFLKKRKFDYIIITEVLEHIAEPEKVISTIREHQKEAVMFVSVPNSAFLPYRMRLLFGRFPAVVIIHHMKEHLRFWTHKDFIEWSKRMGYKVCGFKVNSGISKSRLFASLLGKQIIYMLRSNDGRKR